MKEKIFLAGSYILNGIILTADYAAWIKVIAAILGGLLTIVSLINQLDTFWQKAQKWNILIIIRDKYNSKKLKNDRQTTDKSGQKS